MCVCVSWGVKMRVVGRKKREKGKGWRGRIGRVVRPSLSPPFPPPQQTSPRLSQLLPVERDDANLDRLLLLQLQQQQLLLLLLLLLRPHRRSPRGRLGAAALGLVGGGRGRGGGWWGGVEFGGGELLHVVEAGVVYFKAEEEEAALGEGAQVLHDGVDPVLLLAAYTYIRRV